MLLINEIIKKYDFSFGRERILSEFLEAMFYLYDMMKMYHLGLLKLFLRCEKKCKIPFSELVTFC